MKNSSFLFFAGIKRGIKINILVYTKCYKHKMFVCSIFTYNLRIISKIILDKDTFSKKRKKQNKLQHNAKKTLENSTFVINYFFEKATTNTINDSSQEMHFKRS